METTHWFLLVGLLMLARGLTASLIGALPLTAAIVYLLAGIALGPSGLDVFHFDPLEQASVLEVATEVAVLISLFSAGVKMPVPVRLPRWRPALMLAWGGMLVSVLLVTAFSVLVLGLPVGAGILLGAVLAPTDPVLATDVQSRHPGDNDELRFTLTSEAGMNDGTAFPFVVLGLGLLGQHEIGPFGLRWLLVDVLWATLAAIAIGVLLGALMARAGWALRGPQTKHEVLDDFVGLGLIAVVYGLTVTVLAWGFLAVFFAGVGLRQTELALARKAGIRPELLNGDVAEPADPQAAGIEPPAIVSAEALVFKEHLERLSELMLVLLLGGMMLTHYWSWSALALAGFLFFVARPLSVLASLAGTATSWRIRWMCGWFGIRGIGCLYYLMYAINHGLPEALARDMIALVLVTIVLSILVHGVTVKPMLRRFWRRSREREAGGN